MKIERQWLWNRLKAMSVQEIFHRCWRLVCYVKDSIMFRHGWVSQTGANMRGSERLLFGRSKLMDKDSDKLPLDHLEPYRSFWLGNTVQLFDPDKQYQLGDSIQWLVDPKTRITTPLRFGRSIDYRDDQTVGEIKYLWELGRHQFLIPMAVCVATDKDELVKIRLESHLSSWMEQNPVGLGIHWCSSLELSLRLISWSFIHSILQSGGMRNGIFDLNCNAQLLGVHIYSQVQFIVGNYSRFSSSNNHLIGELTGVWMACNIFDLGAKGRRWRDSAFDELHREIRLQTHDDGVNKEQAVYYHLWSLEYFWLAWSIAKRYGYPVSTAYEEYLVDMIVFLKTMCFSNGLPSQIGDADSGVVSRFNPDISENVYQSLLDPITSVLTDDTQQSSNKMDAYSKAYWYKQIVTQTDVSSISEIYKNKLAKCDTKVAFESGGYFVLQAQDSRMLLKAGPFGYLSTGAHGHADALSVTLAVEDQWWLVDPGTFTYHSSDEWRNYFRSTAAHNTMCVNQSNQSDIAGDFLWSKKTDARIHCVESGTNGSQSRISRVTGSHSGYRDEGVEHERTVKCDGVRTFEIHDLVSRDGGVSECSLQLSFHFHPAINLKQLDTHRWRASRQNSALSLIIELPEKFDWVVKCGSQRPIAGWYSEIYGVKTPSHSLLGIALLKDGESSKTNLYRTSLVIHELDGSELNDGVTT